MSHLQESGADSLLGNPEHFLHLPQPEPPIFAARARRQVDSPALKPSAPQVEDKVQAPRGQGQNSSKSLFQVADLRGQGDHSFSIERNQPRMSSSSPHALPTPLVSPSKLATLRDGHWSRPRPHDPHEKG